MRSALVLAFALPLLAQEPASTPTPAPAATPVPTDNWLTGTIDAGWRFQTGVEGDSNTYRSVVNLGRGPRLFGADLTIRPEENPFVDQIDVHASSWGGDPYNTARVDARKSGLYELSFDYRNIAYFNFLPSFADPGTVNRALPFLDCLEGFELIAKPRGKLIFLTI